MQRTSILEEGVMDANKKLSWEEIHQIQMEEILKHKWLLSEKCGYDMGEEAVWDWITRYAARFRVYWNQYQKKLLHDEEDEG